MSFCRFFLLGGGPRGLGDGARGAPFAPFDFSAGLERHFIDVCVSRPNPISLSSFFMRSLPHFYLFIYIIYFFSFFLFCSSFFFSLSFFLSLFFSLFFSFSPFSFLLLS